jgi:hypothetical protein
LRGALAQVLLADVDTGDWTRGAGGSERSTVLVLSPMNSARDDEERSRCDDVTLEVSLQLKANLDWDVHPFALTDRRDSRSHAELRADHRQWIGEARAVVALGHPPSGGVGYALALVPDSTPLLILAPTSSKVCNMYDQTAIRYWGTPEELAQLVKEFAAELPRSTDAVAPRTTSSSPPENGRQTGQSSNVHPRQTSRPRKRHDQSTASSRGPDHLPGLDDISLLADFMPRVEDAAVSTMRKVLDGTDWKERAWLSQRELDAATAARRRYDWTEAEFGDALAYANMERAFEHYAPLAGVPTRHRRLDSPGIWDRLRRQRRRA